MSLGWKDAGGPNPGGSGLCVLLVFLRLYSSPPAASGFVMKSCHTSYNMAICKKMNLPLVPGDIPPTVTGLDLSSNRLSTVQFSDFRNLPLLTELDLNRNQIWRIDRGAFANLTSLRTLNLNNNKLVELGPEVFLGLKNLTELMINSNQIQEVESTAFRSLQSLKRLDLSYNKLHLLEKVHRIIWNLPCLSQLFLKNNGLGTFNSLELTNTSLPLEHLDLSQNPMAIFRLTADVFPNLTWFNIAGSPRGQRMIWDIQSRSFFSGVSTLDISGLQMVFQDMKTLMETVNASLATLRMNAMKDDLGPMIQMSCNVSSASSLQLRQNKLTFISSDLFRTCFRVTELDLTDNKIKNISADAFRSTQRLRILSLGRNRLSSVPGAIRTLSGLSELDLSFNNISKLGCEDFVNQTKLWKLELQQNSISTLSECLFKGLVQLQVLKLQTNHMVHFGGAFRNHLSNLKQLLLHDNDLTSLATGDFTGLRSLQNLSLHDNKIQSLEKGCFQGLDNLMELLLQQNQVKEMDLNTGCFNDLISLRRLDLRDNHIRYENNSTLPLPPFSQLSRLEVLAMPSQHRRGKSRLPRNFLHGLTNLLVFNARNIQLLQLHQDMFLDTPLLQELDISSNDLMDLSPDLFAPIQNLKILYISRTSLGSLHYLTDANLTKLEFLQARKNQYSVISEEIVRSLPALVYVDFQGNSFTCDCTNAWFLNWVRTNNKTEVYDAYNFKCNYPVDLKGMKLLDLDTGSCSMDLGFLLFISNTCVVFLVLLGSFTYHFLRWHLVYSYYLLLAFLWEKREKHREPNSQFDAFVSYCSHDEPWVVQELLPKLEGEQGWRLCLHHRDFEPGKSIVENIADAIFGSRKTICVISRRYLRSQWCSREIQLASWRLFQEQKDVLILVLLEDIPPSELSPHYRTRKLLKKTTYLSWPEAAHTPQLFWDRLGRALRTTRDHSFPLTVVDTQW